VEIGVIDGPSWPAWCIAIHLHEVAIALLRGLAGVLRLLNLANEQLKSLADVLVVSRARFRPSALDLLRHLLSILCGDLALLGT
jgi:hypothetical protein